MQQTTLALMMAASLLGLSACQPPAETSDTANTANKSDTTQINEKPSTEPPAKVKTPAALTASLLNSSEDQLKKQLICTKLSTVIKKIDNKSKFPDIHAIQRQLEACLPLSDNHEILQWLTEYQAMYQRFLSIDYAIDDDNFYTVMDTVEQGKKPPTESLEMLSSRLQYLIRVVESNPDISVLYVGEGMFIFHHDLQEMADLFSPYLPTDQQAFIQRMAKDNQNIFWNDAAVAIPFKDVINRAIFWEDYVQRYPTSYFHQDAKALLDTYRYVLFFGSDNTRWTDDSFRKFHNEQNGQAIKALAKRPNSTLAQDAQKFLDFIDLSANKRRQQYPVPKLDDEGHKIEGLAKDRYQLTAALPIPPLWDENNNRDCLSGIVCVDYQTQ